MLYSVLTQTGCSYCVKIYTVHSLSIFKAHEKRWGGKASELILPGLRFEPATAGNLVPRAHVPFGQHQDTELWNNQFPETKISGLPASRRMRDLVYMASRDKVDVDTFYKGIQYALERLGKSKFGFESTTV